MRVLFRADASVHTGTGHIMRCLCLARALTPQAEIEFACRDDSGNLIDLISKQGFVVHVLPADKPLTQSQDAAAGLSLLTGTFDLLILDHYLLGRDYCNEMRQLCRRVMVIDDLANRPHDCDLLLDQNLFSDPQSRYQTLVPNHCEMLLGPRFALLREEFYQPPSPSIGGRILVGFGGSDERNLTAQTVEALAELKLPGITADIVIGASYPWREALQQQLKEHDHMQLHIQCDYMAKLMQQATLMIGSGGTTHWERCISALPALVVTVADNQVETTQCLHQLGACKWLGSAEDISLPVLRSQIEDLLQAPQELAGMANAAAALVPADGGARSVVEHIKKVI